MLSLVYNRVNNLGSISKRRLWSGVVLPSHYQLCFVICPFAFRAGERQQIPFPLTLGIPFLIQPHKHQNIHYVSVDFF